MARRTLFDRLFEASVTTEEIDPQSIEGGLVAPEEQAVVRAVDKRINQFTAGVFSIGFVFGAYMTETFRGAILAIPRLRPEGEWGCQVFAPRAATLPASPRVPHE